MRLLQSKILRRYPQPAGNMEADSPVLPAPDPFSDDETLVVLIQLMTY
jgi:hypothetical protein